MFSLFATYEYLFNKTWKQNNLVTLTTALKFNVSWAIQEDNLRHLSKCKTVTHRCNKQIYLYPEQYDLPKVLQYSKNI